MKKHLHFTFRQLQPHTGKLSVPRSGGTLQMTRIRSSGDRGGSRIGRQKRPMGCSRELERASLQTINIANSQ